jgi:uridine phosphorylase
MEFTQHHIKARNEDIAGYCFIPGDHVRGKKIAARLEVARLVADTRGYFVYTGTYKGVRVTVCSTGMGGPQVAIAMEELGNMGVHTFVRLGSAGGLDSRTGVGDIVIATGSYRGGGTGDEYLPKAFPAVADFEVTRALVDAAIDAGAKILCGPVAATDAFYSPQNEANVAVFKRGRALCVEMESDTEFIVGACRGFRCGAAFVLDNGPATKQVAVKSGQMDIAHHGKDPAFVAGEERLIELGLEAVRKLAQRTE